MAMNIIQLQDNLKNLSDQQLAQSMQMPSQDTPPFLVVSELNRRKKMREEFQAQQASQNQTTVAQDVVAAAGVPQQAASDMAQSLAPQTDMTNNTGIMSLPQEAAPMQGMAGGGRVTKMQTGKLITGSDGRIFFPSAIVGGAYYDPATGSFLGGDGAPLPAEALPGVSNEYYQIVKDASNQSQAATTQAGIDLELTPNVDFIEAQKKLKAAQEAQAAAQLQLSQTQNPNPDPFYSHAAGAEAQGPYGSGIPPGTPPSVAPGTPVDLAQLAAMAASKKDTQGDGGGSGGGGGSSKPSSYEQALIDALANADKKAKQDKWMALAQMGLSLMSSQQPNFFAALGEAGTAAIPSFQKARDTAIDEKLALNKGLYDIAMQRQARNDALAAAAAKQQSSGGFGISANAARGLAPFLERTNRAAETLKAMGLNPGSDVTDPALNLSPEAQRKAQAAITEFNNAASTYDTVASMLTGIAGVDNSAAEDPTAPDNVSD